METEKKSSKNRVKRVKKNKNLEEIEKKFEHLTMDSNDARLLDDVRPCDDVRPPDGYKQETLRDELSFQEFSFQDTSIDELEKATLASLEESWKVDAACRQRWNSFQSILVRLKRLGNYDKTIHSLYNLLSVSLYKYAYNTDVSISGEEYIFIDKQMKLFRMTKYEKDNLYDTLNRIRFEVS